MKRYKTTLQTSGEDPKYTRNECKFSGLFLVDDLHLLNDAYLGPYIEAIVSRMRYIATQTEEKIRVVGKNYTRFECSQDLLHSFRVYFSALSTSVSNASDLAEWLGVTGPNFFNFSVSIRENPLDVYTLGENYTRNG